MIYFYGGELDMSCSGGASCTTDDYKVSFDPSGKTTSGYQSVHAYKTELTPPAGEEIHVVPVLDGSAKSTLDALDASQGAAFADKVADTVCSDDDESGIEFDIERFDVSEKGQYGFYMEIAKDFAGYHNGDTQSDPYGCVDSSHPDGRFFAVFTSAHFANPETTGDALARVLNTYGNGFVIGALYDLSSSPWGALSSVSDYTSRARTQVDDMKKWADQLGIDYAFVIPAGASAHEYTTCSGTLCVPDGSDQGYPMLGYTQAAIEQVDVSGARSDPLFIGNDVWFWGPLVHRGSSTDPNVIGPGDPPSGVLIYLEGHL